MSPTAAMLILVNHKPRALLSQETSVLTAVPFFRAKAEEGFKRFLDHIHVFGERSGLERGNMETRGKNPSSEAEIMEERLHAVLEFCW